MELISEELQRKETLRHKQLITLCLASSGFTFSLNSNFFNHFHRLFYEINDSTFLLHNNIQQSINLTIFTASLLYSITGPFLLSRLTRNSLSIIISLTILLASLTLIFASISGVIILRFISSYAASFLPLLCSALAKEYLDKTQHAKVVGCFFMFVGLGDLYVHLSVSYVPDDFVWFLLLIPVLWEGSRLFYLVKYLNFDSPVNTFNRLRCKMLQGKDTFAVPEVVTINMC
jgi:MFS family permease